MSSFSLAPLTSRLRQRLPAARTLDSCATETIVVCEPDDEPLRPAVYRDGELERITGVHEFSAGLEDEIDLATRSHQHHTQTIARRFRNLLLTPGQLCNHQSYRRLTFGPINKRAARVTDIDATTAFCSTDAGNEYFAHFLLDNASTALLGADFGQVMFDGNVSGRTQHTRDYLELFDITLREGRQLRFRDVWLFTDHAQNRHRRQRLQTLRDRVRAHFQSDNAAPALIRRGSSGTARLLENEADVAALLEARGFRIIDPETESVASICRQLAGSPLVVGVEGSQLAHGVLNMAVGGALLCIQPAARFNAVFRGFCNSLGLDWGFVVAEGSAGRFRLCEDRLLRTIDLLLARNAQPC